MKAPMIVAALFAASPVAAQGLFGNAEGCTREAGGENTGDGALIWVQGERMVFHESDCPITGAMSVGSGATLVTLECSGEGETWETNYMVQTTADPDRFVIYPEEFPELRSEVGPCS